MKELKRKNPREAFWGVFELVCFVTTFVILGILNWHYICFLLPFWYFGHCLSYLNGYYRHYGGNPDEPIAWGVSTYGKLYNWTWFYNGYHAEHHFRPKVHWTRMQALRDQIGMAIEADVRNALQSAATAQSKLDAITLARQSAEEQYASEQRQFQAGTSTVFLLFQRQFVQSVMRAGIK